jgi:hypothetical protein
MTPPVETPLWKLQDGRWKDFQGPTCYGVVDTTHVKTKEEIDKEKKAEQDGVSGNLFDAISAEIGSSGGTPGKPLARHALVKDLRKVAAASKVAFPSGGLFANRASVSLYTMFDGNSNPDPGVGQVVAEWCARQLHVKLLANLASSLDEAFDEKTIAGLLAKTMEDLDNDLRTQQQELCGAVVVFVVEDHVFTMGLGQCGGVLRLSSSSAHGSQSSQSSQGGKLNRVSIGNKQGTLGPAFAKGGLLRFLSETKCFRITWDRNPFVLMASAPVLKRLPEEDLLKVAEEFGVKPRAICGELVARAGALAAASGEAVQQAATAVAIAIFFMPSKAVADAAKAADPPLAKKAKTAGASKSVRLRHILVKHRKCPVTADVVRDKVVTRGELEAEAIARGALRELQQEAREAKVPADPKKAAAACLQPSPLFVKLCKERSECATAKNGGGMTGDLGWLSDSQLAGFGPKFSDICNLLQVGQWSDLVQTEHGVHILQRIA